MTKEEDRLVALEEEVAHLRLQNEELSSELLRHWKQTEYLEKKVDNLEERLDTIQSGAGSSNPLEKPPHW